MDQENNSGGKPCEEVQRNIEENIVTRGKSWWYTRWGVLEEGADPAVDLKPTKKERKKGENIYRNNWPSNANSVQRKKQEKYQGLEKINNGKYKLVYEMDTKAKYNCKNRGWFDSDKMSEI